MFIYLYLFVSFVLPSCDFCRGAHLQQMIAFTFPVISNNKFALSGSKAWLNETPNNFIKLKTKS